MKYPNAEELLDEITDLMAQGKIESLEDAYLDNRPGRGYYSSRSSSHHASTGMGNRAVTYVITVEMTAEDYSLECPECDVIFDWDEAEALDEIFDHGRTQHGWTGTDCADILNGMADDDTIDPAQYLQ